VVFLDHPETSAPGFDSVALFNVIRRDSYSLKCRGASCFQRPEFHLAIVAFDFQHDPGMWWSHAHFLDYALNVGKRIVEEARRGCMVRADWQTDAQQRGYRQANYRNNRTKSKSHSPSVDK
jgi:hypothetical protein